MRMLAKRLEPATVETADAVGWSSQSIEAQAFAYLAVRCMRGLPITFPATTGVAQPMRGGVPLPTKLEDILRKALTRKKEDRYRNAAEMRATGVEVELNGRFHNRFETSASLALQKPFQQGDVKRRRVQLR